MRRDPRGIIKEEGVTFSWVNFFSFTPNDKKKKKEK